ncbi:RNA polymerase II transcriptional coactivator KIWI-like [Cynara cardunculus var. scolymus]|uniref:SsDNA-binding transcriptional regulator n=1 Tax=Cynara cardunculus var. scolymus TaxID=59895 RepID=A0A118JS88_CYNCS|nr:RNA polymerase II transcriptional coactivator KIWI-like [Cynara cardunculus var. scolymus]KVH88794.1 ssDNA-binding transcriptional regulator [Cynara cardunculus var. scolymus]
MSFKRGKGKDEEDYFSKHAPPKKTSKKDNSPDDSGDEDDIFICDVSKNRRVSVRNWQGKVVVDIREFYMKDGKQMPGKKGISLSMDQWKELRAHVDEIDKALA